MSIDYTIDIQLTELGFPEVLPPRAAGAKPEARNDSDDSDGSDVYDEEEVEEEEEDDEGNDDSSHSGDFRCSVCDLQLPSKFKLQDHMNLHTGARPYCCAECGKRFCQINSYRVHLRTHAQTKVNPLMCRICRLSFASQEDLRGHLSRTHFEDEFYECDLCKHVFTSLKACENHVQLHACVLNVKCEICGRSFSSLESLACHRKRKCHRVLKCTDCTQTFVKKNALLKHSFSHLGLLPYTCIRCRRHFRLAKLYRQHNCQPQRIHCVACLREFLSQKEFQQHKKDTGCWGNQEPKTDEIRCLECGQRFDTSEELKKHAGAHQRVLKCAECGKGFRSALLLMSHMGGHAGKSPCLCQSCGLGFPHQQSYDSHLRTCGQTPQSVAAPKKRHALKSSSPETKAIASQPESSDHRTVSVPAAPAEGSSSQRRVTEVVTAGSMPAERLWKFTLDKQPPPGAKLLLFIPVCQSQTDGLSAPPTVSLCPPGSAVQIERPPLGANPAIRSLLNAPLNLGILNNRNSEGEAPLDLSKNCKTLLSTTNDAPVKSEPKEFEIAEETDVLKTRHFGNAVSKLNVKPGPGESERDPADPSPTDVNTASSAHTVDIKKEPQSPGVSPDSSRCC